MGPEMRSKNIERSIEYLATRLLPETHSWVHWRMQAWLMMPVESVGESPQYLARSKGHWALSERVTI